MTGMEDMKEAAEYDDDGDLVHEKEIDGPAGTTQTVKTNLSALLNPGKRTTGDVNILVHEARQAASDRNGPDNPAWPADGDTANEAMRKIIDEGLEPAWKGSEVPEVV